jgi:hypothetical protein
MAYYGRSSEDYKPKQWAVNEAPTSGKKRQGEEDGDEGDGNESGDWHYTGAVLTTEEVVRLGKGRQLRSKKS